MSLYMRLELTPRPAMTHPDYFAAVAVAASELRAAEPWLLVPYVPGVYEVARRRSLAMLLVTWAINLWRRPRRWWLGRMQLAYEARQRGRKAGGA